MSGHYICDDCGYDGGLHPEWCRNFRAPLKEHKMTDSPLNKAAIIAEMIATNQKIKDKWRGVPEYAERVGIQIEALKLMLKVQAHDYIGENTRLRAALATSQSACTYCQLPAAEWAACQSGFPGCARADDMAGCPEFGAMMENHDLRTAISDMLEWWNGLASSIRQDIEGSGAIPTAIVRARLAVGITTDDLPA